MSLIIASVLLNVVATALGTFLGLWLAVKIFK